MSSRNSRAEELRAEEPRGIGLVDGALDAAERQVELAPDVHERVAHPERVGGDQHRFHQQVRRVLEDPAVLEGAGLALVGVGAQVVDLARVGLHHAPLAADREGGAAVAQEPRGGDLLRDGRRLHPERLLERRVAAARLVGFQRVRGGGHLEIHDELPAGHYLSSSISLSSFSSLMFSWYASFTITTGAVPQEPRHSTTDRVKRPSGVVSPGLMPSFFDELVDRPLRAAHGAGDVAAGLQVEAPDGRPAQHRVVREHLLDLDARHAEVFDEADDVLLGHEAAVLLDAPQAREHQRGLEPLGVALLHLLELGDEVLHRSHSPPIMLMEPKVGTRSASW